MPDNPSKPIKTNREDFAWAAGLFEGEGSFGYRSQSKRNDRGLVAKIKMADEDVIRKFHSIIKVGNVTGPYKCDGIGKKPLWVWQVGSFEGVQYTMTVLWNWLHARRRNKIEELLRTFHAHPPKRKSLERDAVTGRLLSGGYEYVSRSDKAI